MQLNSGHIELLRGPWGAAARCCAWLLAFCLIGQHSNPLCSGALGHLFVPVERETETPEKEGESVKINATVAGPRRHLMRKPAHLVTGLLSVERCARLGVQVFPGGMDLPAFSACCAELQQRNGCGAALRC